MDSTRTIPLFSVQAINDALAKINRKAEKLGVPGFAITFGEPRVEKRQLPVGGGEDVGVTPTIDVEVVDATIVGEPVQVGGYRLLSRIDFEDGLVLVNTRPGEQLPERFRSTTPVCQHCASQRRRKSVFIFRRNGDSQHVQVGSSCLKDFLGHDPAHLLWAMRLWDELCKSFDEDGSSGLRASQVVGVERVLELATAVVRENNGAFVSKEASRIASERGQHLWSTSSLVFDQLFPPSPKPERWHRVEVVEADTVHAKAAIAWCLEAFNRAGASEYESNLFQLVGNEYIQLKRIGIVASLIGAYNRHLGLVAERAKRVNAHVGEVGKRREFVATFNGSTTYDNDYGTVFIGRFDTPEGLLVYKGNSPFWDCGMKPGAQIKFVATIKSHDEYKGTKQTMVQRAKVIQEEAVAA